MSLATGTQKALPQTQDAPPQNKILSIKVHSFDRGTETTSALCSPSIPQSWISQKLAGQIDPSLQLSPVDKTEDLVVGNVGLRSLGTMEVTWYKESGVDLYRHRFHVSNHFVYEGAMVVGRDVLNKETRLLEEVESVAIFASWPRKQGSDKEKEESKRKAEEEKRKHKEKLEKIKREQAEKKAGEQGK